MNYRESPNYLNATPKEQLWFDTFFASRNEMTATRAAYNVTTDDSARAMGRKVSGQSCVAALIAEFCKNHIPLPTIEELKREYISIARDGASSPRDRLGALTAYERLCGWSKLKAKDDSEGGYNPALDDIQE